jgi:hypothetical protein
LLAAIVVAELWRATAIVLVILVAGVQLIPKEYGEAADVFGATPWQRFTRVTLPLLKPSIQTALIFPEDLQPTDTADGFPFTLRVAEPLGSHITLTGETGGQQLRVVVSPETSVCIGATMHLRPRRDRIVWMDPVSGAAIGRREAGTRGTEAASS